MSIRSTSGWATCSRAGSLTLLAIVVGLAVAPAAANVLLTVDEALALALPGCDVERETIFLTDEEVSAAEQASEEKTRALVVRYTGTREGERVGTVYFDTHRVRSLDETLMVLVAPDGSIGRIEVVSFDEPLDYMPREKWYRQFDGEDLDGDLRLHHSIRAVTGATLTAVATTSAARRVLGIHRVIENRKAP